jgi:hypothetical protein
LNKALDTHTSGFSL